MSALKPSERAANRLVPIGEDLWQADLLDSIKLSQASARNRDRKGNREESGVCPPARPAARWIARPRARALLRMRLGRAKGFGFAPQASVFRRVGRIDRLETTPSKPSLPSCFKMSSPSPVSWPLNCRPGLFATKGSSSALRSMSGSCETSQSAKCKRSNA
jgi:hypothetical protein